MKVHRIAQIGPHFWAGTNASCALQPPQEDQAMVTMVKENAKLYTKRAIKRAITARKFQDIVMRPSSRRLKEIVNR